MCYENKGNDLVMKGNIQSPAVKLSENKLAGLAGLYGSGEWCH